jgi:hypothetical protein
MPAGEHGDECVVGGQLVNITEGVGDGLDAVAVLRDVKTALPLFVKVGGEVDSASPLVGEEDSREGDVELAHHLYGVNDHPCQLLRDGAVDPS